jgi:hypothetical protein
MVTETDESSDDQDEDDADEALDDAAQGVSGTSDETADGSGEIDAIGHAAGLVVKDDKPFRGIDEVDRRDEHRWENDPRSSDGEASTR